MAKDKDAARLSHDQLKNRATRAIRNTAGWAAAEADQVGRAGRRQADLAGRRERQVGRRQVGRNESDTSEPSMCRPMAQTS